MNLRSILTILNIMLPLLIFAQERDSVMVPSSESDTIFNMSELSVYARRADEIVPSQRLSGQRLEALSTHYDGIYVVSTKHIHSSMQTERYYRF